MEMKAA